MRIDRFCDKCILYPETEAIRKVELLYDSGLCTIRFRDGTSSSFLHDWEAYHVAYYGLCFTSDGKTVFTGNWEKGVYALDTASGKIIWHYRCTKIRDLSRGMMILTSACCAQITAGFWLKPRQFCHPAIRSRHHTAIPTVRIFIQSSV